MHESVGVGDLIGSTVPTWLSLDLLASWRTWLKVETETFNAASLALSLVQLLIVYLAARSLRQQKIQLKELKKQIKLQHKEVYVTSFAHFSTMYHSLMAAIPENRDDDGAIARWWFRYWDLLIAETHFCFTDQLDPEIYELWVGEIVRNFSEAPHGVSHMGTIGDSQQKMLGRVLPEGHLIMQFFLALSKLAREERAAKATEALNRLIAEYLSRSKKLKYAHRRG